MKNLHSKPFQVFSAICTIACGAGMLGLLGGWIIPASPTLSYVMGAVFICGGLAQGWSLWCMPRAKDLPQPCPDVLALASAGNKNAAIRAYCKQTRAGLKDAKDIIERHIA